MTQSAGQPLIAACRPSSMLKRTVMAAHGLALAACLANALPVLYKMMLSIAVAGHLYHALKRQNAGLLSLKYSDAGGWQIAHGDEFEPVAIMKSTVVTPVAVWLHVQSRPKTGFFARSDRAFLVPYDCLDEDGYRRLVVTLKTTLAEKR
ncbi:protein YgfX [Methylosarcina fibrata]|uniref:protein YgfX n=1 Tax=Methylosarcina fibrata TaxID=105972 RepID=UPI002FC36B1A